MTWVDTTSGFSFRTAGTCVTFISGRSQITLKSRRPWKTLNPLFTSTPYKQNMDIFLNSNTWIKILRVSDLKLILKYKYEILLNLKISRLCYVQYNFKSTAYACFVLYSFKTTKEKKKTVFIKFQLCVFYYFNSNYFIYKNAQNKAFRKLLYIFEKMILEFFYIPHRFKYINKAFLQKISKEKISFYNLKKGYSIRNN